MTRTSWLFSSGVRLIFDKMLDAISYGNIALSCSSKSAISNTTLPLSELRQLKCSVVDPAGEYPATRILWPMTGESSTYGTQRMISISGEVCA